MHVLDGCSDIRLHEMMRQKFDTAVRKIRYLEELQASNEASLIEVICKCQFIRSLGVGIADFEEIEMPKFNKYDVSKLVANTDDLTKDDKGRIEKEIKKRMEDENEIIEQVKELITETDQKHFELTLYQQAKIKESVITDVKNHLFKCLETWPLWRSPCNKTHPGEVGSNSNHSTSCHRPQGFAGVLWKAVMSLPYLFAVTLLSMVNNLKTLTQVLNGLTIRTIERLTVIMILGIS